VSTPIEKILNWVSGKKKISTPQVRTLTSPQSWEAFGEAINGYPGGYSSLTALRVSAVFACNDRISKDIASLPFRPLRKTDRGYEIAKDHDQYFIGRSPSSLCTKYTFFYTLNSHVNLYGNGYAEIIRKGGRPVEYRILHPTKVTPSVENGRLYWVYDSQVQGEKKRVISDENMIHGMWYTDDGICGKSVLSYAKDTVSLSLSANTMSANLYASQMQMPGYIAYKDELTKEQAEMISYSWSGLLGENGKDTVGVLDKGSEFKTFGMNLKDAEYLGTKELAISDIARFFGVPGSKINIRGENVSYNSLEQENIAYVQDTILPRAIMWEEEFERKALRDADLETVRFKFELKSRLRGDMSARASFYSGTVPNGLLTINDFLRLEDMDTIGPEGDERYVNAAMVPLSKIFSGETMNQSTDTEKLFRAWLSSLDKQNSNGHAHKVS
jgi:HK97 family phage portal protein